uniref:Uncharacterized protein n=1 Tax=Salix viminalis TaxID=40686 RepID=A0A6N2LFX3_SALVM
MQKKTPRPFLRLFTPKNSSVLKFSLQNGRFKPSAVPNLLPLLHQHMYHRFRLPFIVPENIIYLQIRMRSGGH